MSIAVDSASAAWSRSQDQRYGAAGVPQPARAAGRDGPGRDAWPRQGVFALALLASAILHVAALLAIGALGHDRASDRTSAPRHLTVQRQPVVLSLVPPAQAASQSDDVAALITAPGQAHVAAVPEQRSEIVEPASATGPMPPQKEMPPVPRPAQPYYFELRELSQRPQLVSLVEVEAVTDVHPTQPGHLLARVLIGEQGHVDHVLIDESDLPAAFEQAAIDAFLQGRYTPGQVDGRAVRSQIRIEVSYDGPVARDELLSAQAGSAR